MRLSMDVGGPLLDYAAKGSKVEYIGKDTMAGANAYKLKLTTKDNIEITLYIDAKTYYITKTVTHAPGQQNEVKVNFSDYRKTDFGYVMSFSQELVLPQVTLNMTNKKIEINKPIDPSIFDMPK